MNREVGDQSMGMSTTFAKLSGAALLTVGLIGGGTLAASAAFADDEPIAPADAPEIMERPWPEYPADGETHRNIWVATTYLGNQLDPEGNPYWGQDATNTYNPDLEEVLFTYQEDKELGEHGELKEEMWQHFSDIQFGGGVSWGPGDGRDFYDVGDSGPGARAVNSLLNHHGYLDPQDMNDEYDDITRQAVIDFQTDVVCDEAEIRVSVDNCVDGWVGQVTWRALIAFAPQ